MGIGDSSMDGRGLLANVPDGYPPDDGHTWIVKSTATGIEALSEPTARTVSRNSPIGIFCARRKADTGKDVVVANGGFGGSRSDQWLPGTGNYNLAVSLAQKALLNPRVTIGGYLISASLNDLAAGMTMQQWQDNTATTLAALRATLGDGPCFGMRYAVSVEIDNYYPAYVDWREMLGTTDVLDGCAWGPDGPWIDGHLDSMANNEVAIQWAEMAAAWFDP